MNLLSAGLNWLKNSPYLLLIFPPLFWAGNVVLGRGVNQIIPPVTLAFWRWTVALLVLLPLTWRRVRNDWQVIRANWGILLLLSFLGIACFNTMLYTSVHTTTAINGAIIQTSMPAWIVVLALILYKERIGGIQSLGVLICIAGAFSIITHGDLSFFSSLKVVEGDIWMMTAVVLYALYSIFLRKRPQMDDLSLVTITFALGALMLLPLYIWEFSTVGGVVINRIVLGSVLYVAIFPSILAYLCWNRGVELVGASTAGLYINFTPLFASVLAVFLLGESLEIYHLIGALMIVGGMILYNRMSSDS